MKRRVQLALAAAGATIAIASTLSIAKAADSQAAWEGFWTNTGTPPSGCSTVGGVGKGDTHVSIYRPHINSSDTQSFISIVQTRAAITFGNGSESTHPQFNGSGSGNYTAFGINSRGKGFSYSGTYSGLTVTPHPVTASTTTVKVSGTINNYFNTAGCSVKFQAVYVKRAD